MFLEPEAFAAAGPPDPVDGRPRRVGPLAEELLRLAVEHRLQLAMELVCLHLVPAPVVLDLRWPDLDLGAGRLTGPGGVVFVIDGVTAGRLHWHGCRARLDAKVDGRAWSQRGHVFVDEHGWRFRRRRADRVVADFAVQVGLPPVGLSGLAHPCWAAT